MEQEQGCGWGCGFVLLGVVVLALCIAMPYVGLPLGLLIAIVVVVLSLLRPKEEEEPDEPVTVDPGTIGTTPGRKLPAGEASPDFVDDDGDELITGEASPIAKEQSEDPDKDED